MASEIVIFGMGDAGELAHFYFTEAGRPVAAFCADAAFISAATFCDTPVVPFEEVAARLPPDRYDMFVALGYSKVNAVRREKYLAAKALGYRCVSYVSPRANVYPTSEIGENCFIFEDNTIQPFARIGDNVTLWSGNHIGHHSSIGNHCFLASHVVVSGRVEIGDACFLGVNATIRDHVKIGARCVIGAGALILGDADPEGVYAGRATERSRVPSSRLRGI